MRHELHFDTLAKERLESEKALLISAFRQALKTSRQSMSFALQQVQSDERYQRAAELIDTSSWGNLRKAREHTLLALLPEQAQAEYYHEMSRRITANTRSVGQRGYSIWLQRAESYLIEARDLMIHQRSQYQMYGHANVGVQVNAQKEALEAQVAKLDQDQNSEQYRMLQKQVTNIQTALNQGSQNNARLYQQLEHKIAALTDEIHDTRFNRHFNDLVRANNYWFEHKRFF